MNWRHYLLSICLATLVGQQAARAADGAQPLTPGAAPVPGAQAPADQSLLNDVLKDSVTSPSTSAIEAMPQALRDLAPPELPPELVDHNKNKTIKLGQFHTGPLIQIATLNPVRMEARYNQTLTLKDCLVYSLRNSLPIRINFQTAEANRYGLYGQAAGFLPSASTILTFTHGIVYPDVSVNSRVFAESLQFPVFQGGRVLYGTIQQYYRFRAARQQYNASVNDTLLAAYRGYYNLCLQRALLHIRLKAVEVSEVQLRLNEQLYTAGTGTQFAVMQSRTQLALDRQALLQQQVATRIAVLTLGFTMNMPLAVNIIPAEDSITESSLWDEGTGINDILNLTLAHRPELREFELLRLAAARNIQVQTSQIYPTAQWTITYAHTSTSVNPKGAPVGGLASVSNVSLANLSAAGVGNPAVGATTAGSPVIVGTLPPLSPITPGTGNLTITPGLTNTSFGTATSATTTAGSGTTVVTNGSGTLGAVAGSVVSGTGAVSAGGANLPSIGSFGGKFNSVSFQFNLNWTLGNLGAGYAANILQARAGARQALLQSNLALITVGQQVRSAYLNALAAREQIDVTATSVASSTEALRLANLRVQMGVGTNLELIQAQRDYITTLITQAQAIIASNQAQAQLLHDCGLISVSSLTLGLKQPISSAGALQ